MDSELGSRFLASMVSANAELTAIHEEVNWMRGAASALGFGDTYKRLKEVINGPRFMSGLEAVAADYFREMLNERIGLDLEEISEKGLAEAIGRRGGFDLRSLHDLGIISEDLVRAAAERIAARMGWTLERVIRTTDDLLNELERRAAGEIEKRVPGLVLHDLQNLDRVLDDFANFAALKIREKTGIPMRDIRDPDKTKSDLLNWADAECRKRLKIDGTGGGLKMTKKGLRNRLAQRRFYEAHGDRHQYFSVRGG